MRVNVINFVENNVFETCAVSEFFWRLNCGRGSYPTGDSARFFIDPLLIPFATSYSKGGNNCPPSIFIDKHKMTRTQKNALKFLILGKTSKALKYLEQLNADMKKIRYILKTEQFKKAQKRGWITANIVYILYGTRDITRIIQPTAVSDYIKRDRVYISEFTYVKVLHDKPMCIHMLHLEDKDKIKKLKNKKLRTLPILSYAAFHFDYYQKVDEIKKIKSKMSKSYKAGRKRRKVR
ncbi:hypothetical protein [Phocoenobacter skyensis]|uniref:Uncharacterized protein n=1 Tax=Phocoenobacter skyensis TaxID=97481 RepID=A0A1H7XMD0_9PAST|nr:hypothetical protein [Pasteurella skyensis]MDP8184373.1 hypothetical protein [Pasteurella skyensis]QLB22621.1 hypothetical protein A6B44_05135 [Pasteurella skyensis]SEM34347.1 hypothetical protein SAMN05444853_11320 [Pasteurella skyensis]